MKRIISALLLLCIVFTLTGCSAEKKTAKKVIGEWKDLKSDVSAITFEKDDKGTITTKDITNLSMKWMAGDGKVTVEYGLLSTTALNLKVVEEDGIYKLISDDNRSIFVKAADYDKAKEAYLEEVKANTIAIEVNKTYEKADYADIKVKKICSAESIKGSMGSTIFYSAPDGKTYIDIVMDYTNKSQNAVNCDEAIGYVVTKDDGTVYDTTSFYVESENGTDISSYEEIAPLSTVRLHCACAVPKGEGKYTLTLDVNGQLYGYEYTLNEVVNNAKEIKINDVIENEDIATAQLKSVKFSDNVLPSNTSGVYSHYLVDNASNTYLVVRFDITNNQTTERDCDEFINVTATFMNKYTYTGFIVVEDDDGKGFSSYEDVAPLATKKFYCLIEVPKTVVDSNYELLINFAGEEYSYKGK